MSLKKIVLRSFIWTGIEQFSIQFINFGISVVLARLLLPSEFGLIAMIGILMAVGRVLIDSGLDSSLIRTKNPTQMDYSTIFFFNLLGSLIIYFITFFIAPFVASFFKQLNLVPIIRVYSLTFIISAFSQIQHTRLVKLLDFKTLFKISLPSTIVSGFIGVFLAYKGYGVWSLVWISVIQSLIGAIQLWLYSNWRPSFVFDFSGFKNHFTYGYKLTLSSLLNRIFDNLYPIIIGKFFMPAQLGYYTRADSLKQLPVSNFSAIFDKFTFPLLAEIDDDTKRLKSVLQRLIKISIFLIAPLLVYMAAIAEPMFRLVFTEKWLPAVAYFQILCFSGILYPIHNYNLTVLNVLGRSDLFLFLEVIKKILYLVTILIAYQFGIYGLLIGSVLLSFIILFVNSHYSKRFIDYGTFEQFVDISPIIIISLLTGFITYALDSTMSSNNFSDLLRLIFSFFCFLFTFLSFVYIVKLSVVGDLLSFANTKFPEWIVIRFNKNR